MDLSFGPEYEDFRGEVISFLASNADKAPKGNDLRGEQAKNWQKLLIEHGYTCRTIPKEFGGYGAEPDIIKTRIIAEEFSKSRVNTGLGGQGISMLVPTLLEMGTQEQKEQFIRPTIMGDMIWCQGYSEPGAGSDLAALSTAAVLDGDEWVINGQKIWTSTAQIADWIFCLVRSEPDAPKHKGISFLLFDMKTPGIEVRPLVDMTGHANFNETFFTDVRVPKHQIVGERGQGWQVANAILGHERETLAPANTAQTRVNALIELMKNETADGARLIDNLVYRDRLMKIQGKVMAMRCNELRVLSARLNAGQDPGLSRMITKLEGTELRHDLEGLAIDVLGEIGLAYEDNPHLRGAGSWQ
jgi:alkylation response protein AidB-like acyl-CoA dehydrogenase